MAEREHMSNRTQGEMPEEPPFVGPDGYIGRVTVRDCGLCNGWGYHEFGHCVTCKGTGKIAEPTCHRCGNTRGGTPGNEQWIDGVLLCDYCHADDLRKELRV